MNSTDIANLALGRLGVGQAIASLSELSTPAKLCNRFYNYCRQEVLRAHPWGFASRASAIAQLADETYPGWDYVYQYPNDALMVWSVADEGGIRRAVSYISCHDWLGFSNFQGQYSFQKLLSADGASQVLVSDTHSAYAFFTYDVTNTGAFPVDFCGVLASRLAMEVGGPLQAQTGLVQQAKSEYLFWLSQARAQDMNEQRDGRRPESESITCRN